MEKKVTKSGKPDKRVNNKKAGRKPLPAAQKKVSIQIYTSNATIKAVGGMVKAREIALNAVEIEAVNKH